MAQDKQRKKPLPEVAAPSFTEAQLAYNTTPTQDTAIELYELGLNVFPVPFAQKGGWPWRQFQYIRLHPAQLLPVFEGRCNLAVMAGRTSNNLFIIDCETRDSFLYHGDQLAAAGIPIWSVRSGGEKGGGHYYLFCKEGEVGNIPPGELTQTEVRGTRCYVLTPPSVHPDTGVIYQWHRRDGDAPPTVSINDIDWLPLKLLTKSRRAVQEPTAFSELSQATLQFITAGAPEGQRNNALFAAACDMAGNNYDYYTTSQVLTPIARACGLPNNEIRDTLRSAFSQPRTPTRRTTNPKQPQWQAVIAFINQHQWKGRTGQTDRAVLAACAERARLASNEHGVFRASTRELAELARLTKNTVSSSLKRLQKERFLIFCGHDKTSGAHLWQFSKSFLRYRYTDTPWISNSVSITQKTDAAERGALGKTATTVWERLLAAGKPMKVAEMAEAFKLSDHQIYRALNKLSQYELVERQKRGFWVARSVSESWLDEAVAAPAGTLGKGEIRRAQHVQERALRAGEEVLKVRWHELKSAETLQKPVTGSAASILYCQNCGQGLFVFVGTVPPQVCRFCADNYGWKRGTIWLLTPPNPPTRERRKG